MCKAGDATRSFRADLRIGLECAFAPLVVAKWRPPVNRYVILYLATLIVLIPIDFLFQGVVAKGFFTSEVGDMLGEIRPLPAILFYLLYVAGILIFVSGSISATWQTTLLYGALFGLFCYATFELTSLALLKHC